jgi:hypothetical protein
MTTSISPDGVCFDFPYYGADTLPFILRSLKVAKSKALIRKYRRFIDSEVRYYCREVFDRKTCLVRTDRHFSSMKDYAQRPSDCYSNCMMFMLAKDLDSLGVRNPLPTKMIRSAILNGYWNGKFFYDNAKKTDIVTGDANVFPFWCGVTSKKDWFARCVKSMEAARLHRPFPLKYTSELDTSVKMYWLKILAGDYERSSIWMHLGLCYIDVLKRFDRKRFRKHMEQYGKLILMHRNFLEVYDRTGAPFHNFFYYTDESMLWVSKYLALKRTN